MLLSLGPALPLPLLPARVPVATGSVGISLSPQTPILFTFGACTGWAWVWVRVRVARSWQECGRRVVATREGRGMGNELVSCVFTGLSATWVPEPGLAPPPLQPGPRPGESQVGRTSVMGWCSQGLSSK